MAGPSPSATARSSKQAATTSRPSRSTAVAFDLGTPNDLGGNTINVNGGGELIENTSGSPVSIAGDWFTVNGVSVPVNLTVTNTADSGPGSLPYATLEANSNPGAAGSIIGFDPTVFATPQTITLSSTLELTESAGPEVIQGPGRKLLTISGGGAVEVLQVDSEVTATLSALTISDGLAYNGGGIENSGALTITDSTIFYNIAINDGGGIDNRGTLTVTDSVFDSNGAGGTFSSGPGDGGGIYNSGTVHIDGSAFTGNGAGGNGAGIYVSSGVLTIINSTISGNLLSTRTGNGGGIYNLGTLTTVNTTIAYNQTALMPPADSDVGGAGLYDGTGGVATLDNTIVASNWDDGYISTIALPADIGGTPISPSSACNLIGSVAAGGSINGSNGNIVGVNPGLGGLADNGGPTPTIDLMPDSPAIGAGSVSLAVDPTTGSPLATDQRGAGFPREVNGSVDIGAFERPSVTGSPTVYTVDLTSDTDTSTGPYEGDLRYCINQANANTNLAGSVIKFDPTVFATPQTISLTGAQGLGELSGPEVIQGPDPGLLTIIGRQVVLQTNWVGERSSSQG